MALTLGRYYRSSNHLARDLIFVFHHPGQESIVKWLDAYHGLTKGGKGLRGCQSGAIQTALAFDFNLNATEELGTVSVNLEGSAGQLPNLDLFNTISHVAYGQSVPLQFDRRFGISFLDDLFPDTPYFVELRNLLIMMLKLGLGETFFSHSAFLQ